LCVLVGVEGEAGERVVGRKTGLATRGDLALILLIWRVKEGVRGDTSFWKSLIAGWVGRWSGRLEAGSVGREEGEEKEVDHGTSVRRRLW